MKCCQGFNAYMKNYNKTSCLVAVFAVALGSLLTGGCASIVHGGYRDIAINSKPEGAQVTVVKLGSGEVVSTGVTPMTVALKPKQKYFKGQSYTVNFKLAGYKPADLTIRPTLTGWYFGNILFGGLIGMVVVDPLTGAMWNLAPDKIEQSLSAEQVAVIKNKDGFLVVLVSQLSDTERKNLVRLN